MRYALITFIAACGGKTSAPPSTPPTLRLEDQQLRAPCPTPPAPPSPTSAMAWAWARAIAPSLDSFAPNTNATPDHAAWWKPEQKITMYAPKDWIDGGQASTCVPITMTANGSELHAVVTQAGIDAPRFGCRMELVLGRTAELANAGCPSKSAPAYGIAGDARVIGHDLAIDDDGTLDYDAVAVTMAPSCRWITVERPGCAEHTCRSCQIALHPNAQTANAVGFGLAQDPAPIVAPNACEPCPIDHGEEAIPQLTEILRGRVFTQRLGGGVHFSPTKAACEARARG